MDAGIYQIRNIVNDRRYIGEGMAMRARFKQHQSDLRCGSHANARLQEDWSMLGPDAFSFERVAFIAGHTERRAVEVRSIAALFGDGCYNAVVCGPPSHIGATRTPEHVAAIRLAQAGNQHGVGNVMSDEHKAALRAALCGKPRSADVRAKISASRTGKKYGPLSAAHRAAVGAGQARAWARRRKAGGS